MMPNSAFFLFCLSNRWVARYQSNHRQTHGACAAINSILKHLDFATLSVSLSQESVGFFTLGKAYTWYTRNIQHSY